MEKYSKWRDPATGIQPFLPPVPPSSVSPILIALLSPPSALQVAVRIPLLSVLAALHFLLQSITVIFTPIPPLYRAVNGWFTWATCRLALVHMGYWWIDQEMVSSKRGKQGVTQIANRSPRRGDLILSNYTSYIDVLYLSARYSPTFLLPVFSDEAALPAFPTAPTGTPSKPASTGPKFGRATGTGSANVTTNQTLPQPSLLGYVAVPFWTMLAQTGQLPLMATVPPVGMYKTLREARRKENRPVVLFPEGTTSNGRAILRFGEGVLAEGDVGGDQDGQVWVTYLRHPAPSPFVATPTCSVPQPIKHLLTSLLFTPTPFGRTLTERTLHPSASPSSPSFLPSEILASVPGGLEAAGRDGKGAWREACSVVLAETGRTRRVKLGWVEKEGFIEYWRSKRR